MKPKFERSIAVLLSIHLLTSSQISWALQPPSNLTNNKASVNCDDFCAQFLPTGDSKLPAGLFSSNAWSTTDDQLCAELGEATTTARAAIPTPNASFTDTNACVNV